MYWIARPPYLRWIIVAFVVLFSLWIELRPDPTTLHPFTEREIGRGAPVAAAIEWRLIPVGVLPPVEGLGFAAHELAAGEPILPSDLVAEPFLAPDGWWIVDVELPADTRIGSPVQLVIVPSVGDAIRAPIAGIVMSVRSSDGNFGSGLPSGSVAVAPEDAATAAVAIANKQVSVLIQYPE